MTVVHTLAHFFAPWQSLYGDSKSVAAVVNAVHLTGLLFGGGLAVAADRTTLRALKGERTDRCARSRSWARCTGPCCWPSPCSS